MGLVVCEQNLTQFFGSLFIKIQKNNYKHVECRWSGFDGIDIARIMIYEFSKRAIHNPELTTNHKMPL